MIYADEAHHIVPVIAPVDTTSTTINSDVVGLKEYHGVEFLINFGVITGDTVVVTVEECDDTTPTTTTAITFHYRKSSAVGTDSMGSLTAATTSGVTIAATDDNKLLAIYVDGAQLSDGYPYIRFVADPGASMSACLISAVAVLKPRYEQDSQLSAVD